MHIWNILWIILDCSTLC